MRALLALSLFLLPACESTYKKETLKESVRDLAKKTVGLDVDVAETGRTLGLRFRVPDLAGELSSGDADLFKKMNGLFVVLVRVALSSDVPPRFVVLDLVDEERPHFHLVFTRYVEDIRRSMAEAISYTDAQDRLLEEIVIGSRRVPFDPYEMELVRLVMLSVDAPDALGGVPVFKVDDVVFENFVADVTENKARRIFRERDDTKSEFMLREVQAGFDLMAKDAGTFRILLDLVSTGGATPQLPVLDTVLPLVAREAGQLFHSYRFNGASIIQVVEKNTGKMIAIPAPKR